MIAGSTKKELVLSVVWVLGCFLFAHFSAILMT